MPARQTSLYQTSSSLTWVEPRQEALTVGLADHAGVWSSLGDHLAQRYHITPICVVMAKVASPDSGYTFADVIADLEALMDHLGWPRISLVTLGQANWHSFGLGNIRHAEPDPSRSVFS